MSLKFSELLFHIIVKDSKIRGGWFSETMTTLRVRLEVTFLTRLSNSRNFSLLPHEHRPFVVYGVSLCIRINFIATITKKTVVSCTYNNELWNYSNSSRWREKFLN